MLVLTRKAQQTIRIGEDIEVSVLSVDRGAVRLGITAPRRVPVLRTELRERPAAVPATAVAPEPATA
jgi:carbon storage regulator